MSNLGWIRSAAELAPYPGGDYDPNAQWLVVVPIPQEVAGTYGIQGEGHYSLAYLDAFPQEQPYHELLRRMSALATRHQPFEVVVDPNLYQLTLSAPDEQGRRDSRVSLAGDPVEPEEIKVMEFTRPDGGGLEALTRLGEDAVRALDGDGFFVRPFPQFVAHSSIPGTFARAPGGPQTAVGRYTPSGSFRVEHIEVWWTHGAEARVALGTGQVENLSLPLDEEARSPRRRKDEVDPMGKVARVASLMRGVTALAEAEALWRLASDREPVTATLPIPEVGDYPVAVVRDVSTAEWDQLRDVVSEVCRVAQPFEADASRLVQAGQIVRLALQQAGFVVLGDFAPAFPEGVSALVSGVELRRGQHKVLMPFAKD